MKNTFLLVFLIYILSSCNDGRMDINEHLIPLDSLINGSFVEGYSDIGTELKFNKDGTFEQTMFFYSDILAPDEPSGLLTTFYGTFKIDSNRLELQPVSIINKEDWGDLTKVIDSLEYYESDSTWIRTSFVYVEWNGNIYLLSEEPSFRYGYRRDNDFVYFANNYNSGSEPKWPAPYFAKRNNETKVENLDLSQIPSRWRPYFVDSVAYIVVTDIEQNYLYDSMYETQIHRYILKGGIEDQVLEGMTFYGNDGCCTLKIIESDNSTSKGIIELCPYQQNSCKIGDVLTTWNQRDNGRYVPPF